MQDNEEKEFDQEDPHLKRVAGLLLDIRDSNFFLCFSRNGFAEPGYQTGFSGMVVCADWGACPPVFSRHRAAFEGLGVRTEDADWSQCESCKRVYLSSPDDENWLKYGHDDWCADCIRKDESLLSKVIYLELGKKVPLITFEDDLGLFNLGYARVARWLNNDHQAKHRVPCPASIADKLRRAKCEKFVFVAHTKESFSTTFDVFVHTSEIGKLLNFMSFPGVLNNDFLLNSGKKPPSFFLNRIFAQSASEWWRRRNQANKKRKHVNSYFAGDIVTSDLVGFDDMNEINPASHKSLWTPWEHDWVFVDNFAFPSYYEARLAKFLITADSLDCQLLTRFDVKSLKMLGVERNNPIFSRIEAHKSHTFVVPPTRFAQYGNISEAVLSGGRSYKSTKIDFIGLYA